MVVPRKDAEFTRLQSEFQATHDSSFAWESAVSAYLSLPALRGFWPMSVSDSGGAINDLSGNDLHLTNRNTVLQLATPMPAVDINSGSSELLYRADEADFDILGNESFIHSDYRGLTIGAWAYFDAVAQHSGIAGKWTSGQKSYLLHMNNVGQAEMYVSNDGAAQIYATYSAAALVTGRWYFLCGRFDPSTEIKIWVNDNSNIKTVNVPATLFNGTASFAVGAWGTQPATWTSFMDGRVSMVFLCAAYLPDHTVRRLYYRTRPLFQTREAYT